MKNEEKMIIAVLELLEKIEWDIKRIKNVIKNHKKQEDTETDNIKEVSEKLATYEEGEARIIEGLFDGIFMVWADGKKYPVPTNYSSKSKLISNDLLKLKIMPDWKLVYKLIWPAPRKYIRATVSKYDDWKFIAIWDDWKTYNLNPAATSFFKIKLGDELSIIVNAEWKWDYAAIESKL